MKKTPLNFKSKRKVLELQAEEPIRIQLAQRAGGEPVLIPRKGYTQVICHGGTCECGCGKSTNYILEPHEKHTRGQGGKLSLENTIMILRGCHERLQNNLPKWSH